jgi:hypothetical protein
MGLAPAMGSVPAKRASVGRPPNLRRPGSRATWSATVEVLGQAGVLDAQALRVLARYHRPVDLDPHGRIGAEAVPDFDLAPLGELV